MSITAMLAHMLAHVQRAARGLFFGGRVAADSADKPTTARLEGREQAAALPPAQRTPAGGFAPARAGTAEPAAPPSVAEETTRKLSL